VRPTLVRRVSVAVILCLVIGGLWFSVRVVAGRQLLRLAETGDVHGLRSVLRYGADPNVREWPSGKISSQCTPIMRAVERGCRDCVLALIEAGADVDATDAHRRSVLSYAVYRPEMVRLLLEHGAIADQCLREEHVRAWTTYSALASAVKIREADSLRLLLDAGIDPSGPCFRFALFDYMGAWAPIPVDDTIFALLIRHTQGDLLDEGPMLLWTAADSNAVESARLLLGFGVGVDARSPIGLTPLMEAAGSGSVEVAALLLDRGADRTLKDSAGKTALDHVAAAEAKGVSADRIEALRRLLAAGDEGR
jgi:ankyrin repeat protein